jgi:segregation and condensation protein B
MADEPPTPETEELAEPDDVTGPVTGDSDASAEADEQADAEAEADARLDLSKADLLKDADADAEDADADDSPEGAVKPEDDLELRRTIEALLFAAEAPLSLREIAKASEIKPGAARRVLNALQHQLDEEQRPWEIVEVAGGYRFQTRTQYFRAVQKVTTQRTQRKLTPAALETLAFIAYSKESVSRADVERVRGVDSGPVLRQLLDRKLIKIAGRGTGLGQPLLYGITPEFLEYFGLQSADDLPQPGELRG